MQPNDRTREVEEANLEAARSLGDAESFFVIERYVGGESRRIYELDLRKAIARLAEDLGRIEAELRAQVEEVPAC